MQFCSIGNSSNKTKNIITSILQGPARDHINQVILSVVDEAISKLGHVQTFKN